MVKMCLLGFVAYSLTLLALLYTPGLAGFAGPLPAVVLGAFWWPYAFVSVAMLLYTYDLPVSRLLGPSVRLKRLMMDRMAAAAAKRL